MQGECHVKYGALSVRVAKKEHGGCIFWSDASSRNILSDKDFVEDIV